MVVFVLNLKSQSIISLFFLLFSVLKKILKCIFLLLLICSTRVCLFSKNIHIFSFFSVFQAKEIMSSYQTGILENSAKMVLLFHLIEESVKKRDKLLIFR